METSTPENNYSLIEDEQLFIGTEAAAYLLGIGLNRIKWLCGTRFEGFPAVKDGKKYLIHKKLLIAWSEKIAAENIQLSF